MGTNAGQKPIATARWRAFTDQEQVKLEAGWEKLEAERREERAKKEKKERKKDRQGEAEEVKEAVEAGALDPGAFTLQIRRSFDALTFDAQQTLNHLIATP